MCWAISGFVAGWLVGVAMGPMVEGAITRLLK